MMKNKRWVIIGFCLVSMFALVGCQNVKTENVSASKESGSAEMIEPKQLISEEEAGMLLGASVAQVEEKEKAVIGQKICFYSVLNDNVNGFLQISLTQNAFFNDPSAMSAKDIYDSTKEMFAEVAKPVEGIGDEAFLATGGYYILYKGYYISIFSGNTDKPEVLERLDSAGTLAVKNLDALLH